MRVLGRYLLIVTALCGVFLVVLVGFGHALSFFGERMLGERVATSASDRAAARTARTKSGAPHSSDLTPVAQPASDKPAADTAKDAAEAGRMMLYQASLRMQPSTDAARLSLLQQGTHVRLLEEQGEWAQVQAVGTGERGWVLSKQMGSLGDAVPSAGDGTASIAAPADAVTQAARMPRENAAEASARRSARRTAHATAQEPRVMRYRLPGGETIVVRRGNPNSY